jgi:hypothetical protein
VLASHYAEPLQRIVRVAADLRAAPSAEAPVIRRVERDEPFAMLEESVGWAWGYAGRERRVGYIPIEALSAAY